MNNREYTEEELTHLREHGFKEIIDEISIDEKDPRSIHYQRKLVRPKIPWLRIIIFIILPLIISFGLAFLLPLLSINLLWRILIIIFWLIFYLFIHLKIIAIMMVTLYQRFAPTNIRMQCRFEPSCSEYMILSLKKYGFFKGIRKGLNRIKRCKSKDGGYDLP